MGKHRLIAERHQRAAARPEPGRHAEDHRRAGAPVVEIGHLGRRRDHVVHRRQQDVRESHFQDWTESSDRGDDRGPDEARFRDRRLEDAVGAELLDQPERRADETAEHADVLAHDIDRRVPAHFLGQRLGDGLAIRDLSHRVPLST